MPDSVNSIYQTRYENKDYIVKEYGPLVSTLCRRMIEDREGARDAAQEVWIEVLKSLPVFRGESKLSTWITVIAKRTISRWTEKERLYSYREINIGCRNPILPPVEEWGGEDPERLDLWTRLICDICLTSILHCLEPETRFIFILRTVLQMDYRQISEIMGITYSAVRQRYSRAVRKLSNFGKSDCVLLNPDGPCRCAQNVFLEQTTLIEEFSKLRKTVDLMETWLNAEKVFPGINYWKEML